MIVEFEEEGRVYRLESKAECVTPTQRLLWDNVEQSDPNDLEWWFHWKSKARRVPETA